VGNPSGCGSHYLLQQCYTSRCISGRKVSGRSTKRTSFIGRIPIRGSDTKRDELHWECFCKQSSLARVVNRAYRSSVTSYPLAYSVVVLPISLARWLQPKHHVPSATTFFAVTLFYLSGAINVLLFLIIRPELLLFPRPELLPEPEMRLAPQGTGLAILSNAENFQNSPEPTSMELGDKDSRNGAAVSRVSSRRISDDI
jgi:hypothetical protein